MFKKILGRGRFSDEYIRLYPNCRKVEFTILSLSRDGLFYNIHFDGNSKKSKTCYHVDYVDLISTVQTGPTDLDKLKKCYTELGIKFHEVVGDDGCTYINKFSVHDVLGYINVFGHGLVKLQHPSQLTEFFEFDPTGKLVSW